MIFRPTLSVVIAVKNHHEIHSNFLMLVQTIDEQQLKVQCVFACESDYDVRKIPESSASKTIICPPNSSILNLWGIGLASSNSEYVATLDNRCPPGRDWLSSVLDQIDQNCPCFYGPVEPGWPASNPKILGYLIEYAQFSSAVERKNEYPGNNIVIKSEYIEPADKLLLHGFFKTFTLWNMQNTVNTKPKYVEGMSIDYLKTYSLGRYLIHRLRHGRYFAQERITQRNQPPRLLCILFTPALGLLRTFRILLNIKTNTRLVRLYMLYLPLILISEYFWSFGEFLGYCFGRSTLKTVADRSIGL